jgi:hypothetical protein
MTAAVETAEGVYTVDVESEQIVDFVAGAELSVSPAPRVELPLLVTAAAEGSTVVALLDRRPPLAVSHDTGRTWREAGAGLPPGKAIAIAEGNPDLLLYASANRLHVSSDGGRFWRALAVELPEIEGVGWLEPADAL